MTRIEAYTQLLMGKVVYIPRVMNKPWRMLEDRRIVVGTGYDMTVHFLTMHNLANGWELYERTSKER